jgi:hypothetical protein
MNDKDIHSNIEEGFYKSAVEKQIYVTAVLKIHEA